MIHLPVRCDYGQRRTVHYHPKQLVSANLSVTLYGGLIAPAFVWFSDILIGLPDNLIQAIAAVWLVVMSIFVPAVVERVIDGF